MYNFTKHKLYAQLKDSRILLAGLPFQARQSIQIVYGALLEDILFKRLILRFLIAASEVPRTMQSS